MALSATVPALLAAAPDAPAAVLNDHIFRRDGLDAAARCAAAGLAELGIKSGDRVALWLPNGIEWLVLFFACQHAGAIAVAVNTRFRNAEVGDILARTGARVLAYAPGFKGIDFAAILADVAPADMAALETVIVCGDYAPKEKTRRTVDYATLAARAPLSHSLAAPELGSVIFTTSGTTRAPKFVLLDQHAIAGHAREAAVAFGYDAPDTVLLQALPLCGTFGLAQAMAALAAGRPLVLMPAFDAGAAAALIGRHRVTNFNAADDMIRRIMDAARPEDLASLRWLGYAAFANPDARDLIETADACGLTLAGLYGMSEVQALFAHQPEDGPAATRAWAGGRLTSPAAAARVRDPDSGHLLGDDEAGMLELKGPSMFREYFGDPGATADAMTDDGYVRTGDLGRMDGEGFVFLTRMGDSLRLGGFLVSPGEIEAWVERHTTIAACQTVAIDDAGSPVPVAFVVPAKGAAFDEAAIIAHCTQGLAKFKVPRQVIALDAFPVTESANGVKIQRGKLRDMALAAADARKP